MGLHRTFVSFPDVRNVAPWWNLTVCSSMKRTVSITIVEKQWWISLNSQIAWSWQEHNLQRILLAKSWPSSSIKSSLLLRLIGSQPSREDTSCKYWAKHRKLCLSCLKNITSCKESLNSWKQQKLSELQVWTPQWKERRELSQVPSQEYLLVGEIKLRQLNLQHAYETLKS